MNKKSENKKKTTLMLKMMQKTINRDIVDSDEDILGCFNRLYYYDYKNINQIGLTSLQSIWDSRI